MVSARLTWLRGVVSAALLGALAATGAVAQGGVSERVAQLRSRLAKPSPTDTVVIAHRSCWLDTAENSLAAVRACIRMGVDGIEFDVRHSRDGVPVVIHDETVDRTTDGHGKVSDLTLAQLKALHLKPGNGRNALAPTAETIPTLEEFFAAAKDQLLLVFDVKDLTQAESFRIAKAAGVDAQAIFFYECANDLLLSRIRPFRDEVILFPITFGDGPPLSEALAKCPSNPANMVHAKFSDERTLTAPAARAALAGKRVWVATMFPEDVAGHWDAAALQDPDANWGWLMRAGANMIMTNQPAALLAYLKQQGQIRPVQTNAESSGRP